MMLGNIYKQAKDIITPNINIQAKKKDGIDYDDVEAINQLIKRAETKQRNHVNDTKIVVSLTDEFLPDTEMKAFKSNIVLINGYQFASLIIQFGITGEINE